jgi:hypothetical protein
MGAASSIRSIRLRSISAHPGGAEISVALTETISGMVTPFAETLVVIFCSLLFLFLEYVFQIRNCFIGDREVIQAITAACVPTQMRH